MSGSANPTVGFLRAHFFELPLSCRLLHAWTCLVLLSSIGSCFCSSRSFTLQFSTSSVRSIHFHQSHMSPTVAQATAKASEAIAGSAVKDFKRESAAARLTGAGKNRGQLIWLWMLTTPSGRRYLRTRPLPSRRHNRKAPHEQPRQGASTSTHCAHPNRLRRLTEPPLGRPLKLQCRHIPRQGLGCAASAHDVALPGSRVCGSVQDLAEDLQVRRAAVCAGLPGEESWG